MRRSSLNRFVPSSRRQIIRSFHFPLIVANEVTRSGGSQSKRGALDFITKWREPPRSQPPPRGCDQHSHSLILSYTALFEVLPRRWLVCTKHEKKCSGGQLVLVPY